MTRSLLLFFLLLSSLVHAQIPPNPGFEQWILVGGWFENPEHWQTNNNQLITPVTKDPVDNTEGLYAMSVGANGWAQNRFTVQADIAGFLFDWYFISTASDTAFVIMKGYYNGSIAGSDTAEFYTNSGSTGAIAFPGLLLWVDSIDITVTGGDNLNTYLVVDNFREIITGIEETQTSEASIRYASSNELLLISAMENSELFIYNTAGMLVSQLKLNSSETSVNVSSFAKGIYYAQLFSPDEKQCLKFVRN